MSIILVTQAWCSNKHLKHSPEVLIIPVLAFAVSFFSKLQSQMLWLPLQIGHLLAPFSSFGSGFRSLIRNTTRLGKGLLRFSPLSIWLNRSLCFGCSSIALSLRKLNSWVVAFALSLTFFCAHPVLSSSLSLEQTIKLTIGSQLLILPPKFGRARSICLVKSMIRRRLAYPLGPQLAWTQRTSLCVHSPILRCDHNVCEGQFMWQHSWF